MMNTGTPNCLIDKEPKTFDEMASILLSKSNCRVNGKGFAVLDLHKYVKISVEMVELMPLEQRKTHIITKTSKRSMIKVYNAYLDGNIEPTNTKRSRKSSSIYGI